MTTTTDPLPIELPDAPRIPGLRFRPIDLDADAPGIAALINDSAVVDGVEFAISAEDVRHDLEHQANFDLGRDVLVAEIDGRIVGEVEQKVVVRDGVAVHQWDAWVHPDDRGRGIGRTLTRWVERRAREAAVTWPGQEPHELGAWVDSEITPASPCSSRRATTGSATDS